MAFETFHVCRTLTTLLSLHEVLDFPPSKTPLFHKSSGSARPKIMRDDKMLVERSLFYKSFFRLDRSPNSLSVRYDSVFFLKALFLKFLLRV